MKPWHKWTLTALILAMLAGGAVHTLNARKIKAAALQALQQAQMTEVTLQIQSADVVRAKTLPLAQSLSITGTLVAVHSAMVKTRLAGELIALSVHEGDRVQAGQVIARIDAKDAQAQVRQAQEQMQAIQAQVDIAQRVFDNNQALVLQGFISSTALQTSRANLNAALANVAAAMAAVDIASKALADTVVRAPISGQIAQRLAQVGERVSMDARIVEIIDNNRLELSATLNTADAQQVRVGQTAQLALEAQEGRVAARVVRINPSANIGNRGVTIYLTVAPGSPLRHGQFVQGQLLTGETLVLALPVNVVRTEAPEPFVQVIVNDHVQHQKVRLSGQGRYQGAAYLGISGVTENAPLLSGRLGLVRSGTAVTVVPSPKGQP